MTVHESTKTIYPHDRSDVQIIAVHSQTWLFDRACSKFDSNRVEQEIFVRRIESSRSHCSIENFEFESSRFTCSIDVRLEMFEMLEKKVIYVDLYVRIGDIKGC